MRQETIGVPAPLAISRSVCSSLRTTFPERRLSEITTAEIETCLAEKDWSARTRINYLTKISQLYNYALRHEWVSVNLATRIERPTAEDKEPGIFTINQAENLLKHAGEHGLLPYISIGLLAGLRSAELMRLDWLAVNLQEKAIVVGAAVAKKRSRRVVEVCDALEAWLQLCVQETGPIVPAAEFRAHMKALKTAAGLEN